MDLLSLDSGLASTGFSLTKDHHCAWEKETKRFKMLRGEIIVLCFALEHTIELAIADLILPATSLRSPDWLHRRHDEFQHEILEGLDLRRKMEILCSLLDTRCPKQRGSIKELRSLFNQIRSLRNNMAHCPVIFEAISQKSVLLRPLLETTKGYIHITDKLITLNKNNILKSAEILSTLMNKMHSRKRNSEIVHL
jgi:hypothetical protein